MNRPLEATEHPWRSAVEQVGLTLKHVHRSNVRPVVAFTYQPNHHWRNGATLIIEVKRGKTKLEWTDYCGKGGTTLESLLNHIAQGEANYTKLVAHHDAGTGPFKP